MNASLDEQIQQLLDQSVEQYRPQIEKAYQLASRAHEHQTRASGEPYVTHVVAVAGS